MKPVERCEVLIIGSGPGGAVTAWTLASRGKDVLMIEEGPHLPLDSCAPFSIDEMRQKYRCGGLNPALGSPKVPLVEGRCVGGGSEINSGLYHRAPEEILESWRKQYRVALLADDDLRPHFETCESALSVQLNPGPRPGPAVKMSLGAERLGWNCVEAPRWYTYQPGPDGRVAAKRRSMTESLIPCAQRLGCRVEPDVRALRLMRESGRWKVSALRGGTGVLIEADAVFVACGAIQTPALLRRSGIREHIGNSLALHPTVKVAALFDEEINDQPGDVAAQQVKEFSPAIGIGCSISSPPYLALAMAGHPDSGVDIRRDWRRMSIYYAMITGPATGKVRNAPFSSEPMVRYSLDTADLRLLATALRRLCELLLAAGARRLYPSIDGFAPIDGHEDLSRIPAMLPRDRTNLMTVHVFSSCPMGEARERCAAGSFGQVHDLRNLFLADASLLCTAPGVNPQGAIMAVARRNALHFLGDLG